MIGTIFYLLGSVNFFLDSAFTKKMSRKLIILVAITLSMISYQDIYKAGWKITKKVIKRFIYFFILFLLITAVILLYTCMMNNFKINIKYW